MNTETLTPLAQYYVRSILQRLEIYENEDLKLQLTYEGVVKSARDELYHFFKGQLNVEKGEHILTIRKGRITVILTLDGEPFAPIS